jgi:putative hydrolase of the HAD superfamily
MARKAPIVPLGELRTILLDMDGTLLDKYFDDYFWEHLVPEKYAEKHNITFGKARELLLSTYRRHEGTLNWTDLDFWSRELDLDIPALKEQIRHLIEVHPHVEEFLAEMRRRRKRLYMVTNAHYKAVDIKLRKTGIGRYFHRVLTSFELGAPKESLRFWQRAQQSLDFELHSTLLVDDSEEILRVARRFGIRWLLLKLGASSKGLDKRPSGQFPVLRDFRELLR